MSWVNLGEVFYVVHRNAGGVEADQKLTMLRGLLTLDLPDAGRIIAAARVKAAHPIAYADAFAVATAAAHDATLLTGDPELLERDVGCRIDSLR
jgi:predicted nucleic acid-binding protein